jgi:hypothetical protein
MMNSVKGEDKGIFSMYIYKKVLRKLERRPSIHTPPKMKKCIKPGNLKYWKTS